ncbi:B12-binding domain-containing radical SAM protein [Chloroflexota bacterium]
MKVLFVDAADVYLGRRPASNKVAPLIGMAYVATYVRAQGQDVRVYDLMTGQRMGSSLGQALAEFSPEVVGLTSTTPFIPATYHAAQTVRQVLPDTSIILGGPHATILPIDCFEECPEIDYIIVGEGEQSFAELVQSLSTGGNGRDMPGVMKRGEPLGNLRKRPLMDNLDELPFPDWSFYHYAAYDQVYSYRLGRMENLFQVLLSRGCPYQCSFCYNIFGASYRTRSAANVRSEMESAFNRFDARFFDFVDPTLTIEKPRFLKLCQELGDSLMAGEIAWSFETRVDQVSEELLNRARLAGCESILFGIESGSQAILDTMGKGITIEQAWEALDAAARANLHIKVTLIIGHPYETRKTLDETLDFMRKARATYNVEFMPAFLGIYPGTRTYEMVENGEGGTRWVDGVRHNWQRARRDRPMIEIGELNTAVLVDYMTELKSIIGE